MYSEGGSRTTRGVPALKGCERELVADAIGAVDWMSGLWFLKGGGGG